MDEAEVAVWTTAIAAGAGILGALGGALFGGLVTYWVERQRWNRDDARRWDDRKHADYRNVLRAGRDRLEDARRASTSFGAGAKEVEKLAPVRELEAAIAQARMLAPDAVRDALDRLSHASELFSLAQIGFDEGPIDAWLDQLRAAFGGVEDAIRTDLGADR
jgi:hypothetical protein